MSRDERRDGARFLTELSVVLRPIKGGEPIDDRATAHDISTRGFKLESQAKIADGSLISFTLELPRGEKVEGRGRVAWSKQEPFACWAGVEITRMSWGDKRRLNRTLNPDTVDWAHLSDITFKLIMSVTVVIAAHRIAVDASMRQLAEHLAPKILGVTVMGWALLGMLKRDKR